MYRPNKSIEETERREASYDGQAEMWRLIKCDDIRVCLKKQGHGYTV
jgi:hypothetical protein